MAKLNERTSFERSADINRDSGVVPGVKLLGAVSRNGRRYSESALQKASALYEGAPVYLNHVSPGSQRDVRDLGGEIRNARYVEGKGLFGDLHYLKGDSAGEKIATLAEGNLRNVGMSHDADGSVKRVGRENVVEEITAVNSVDVVHNPATTHNFRESEMTTLRKLIEAAGYSHDAVKLIEMLPGEVDPMAEMPEIEAPESSDPVDAVAAALGAKVLDAIKDGSIPSAEVGKMAKAASDLVDKVRSDMAPPEEAPAEEDTEGEDKPADEKTPESVAAPEIGKLTEAIDALQKTVAKQSRELDARNVLESIGARVTPELIEELAAKGSRKAMQTLAESWDGSKLGLPRPQVNGHRAIGTFPSDHNAFVRELKRR